MAGQHVVHTLSQPSLTLASGTELRTELVGALEAARDALVIDFHQVQYIDSHCIGVLVLTARLARRTTRIALARLQPAVERSFQISQLHRILPVFPTVEAALLELDCPEALTQNA